MRGDNRSDSGTPDYTMGYSEEFQQTLRRRSAQTHAAHLLPYFKPGLRVLDFGCGPGTISVGLAKAVEPGEFHGIDMEASQIEMARAAASAGGHTNMNLHTGDVTALPFADDYFDVAHCHAVLTHVPDTRAVLGEVRRVLKPGGILSCRELNCGSSFFEPADKNLDLAWRTFANLLAANGGHPQIRKELNRAFTEAEFSAIHFSASFEFHGTAEDVDYFHGVSVGWFCSPDTVDAAVKHGLADRSQFEDWRRQLDRWKDEPGACAAIAWGEAIGRKI